MVRKRVFFYHSIDIWKGDNARIKPNTLSPPIVELVCLWQINTSQRDTIEISCRRHAANF